MRPHFLARASGPGPHRIRGSGGRCRDGTEVVRRSTSDVGSVLAMRRSDGGHHGGIFFFQLREAVLETPWMRIVVEMELLQHGQFRWGAPCSSSFGSGTLRIGEGCGCGNGLDGNANAGLFSRCWPRDGNGFQSIQPPPPLNLSHEEQALLALARGWRLVVQDCRLGAHDSRRPSFLCQWLISAYRLHCPGVRAVRHRHQWPLSAAPIGTTR